MPLLLADLIYSRDCKLNLRKNVDTTVLRICVDCEKSQQAELGDQKHAERYPHLLFLCLFWRGLWFDTKVWKGFSQNFSTDRSRQSSASGAPDVRFVLANQYCQPRVVDRRYRHEAHDPGALVIAVQFLAGTALSST